MRLNNLEKSLHDKLQVAIQDVTPGVQVRVYQTGRMVCDVAVGQTFPYYDLASLTKVIFTQQAMMYAFSQNLWNIETKVKDILPDFFDAQMTIKSLLTHTSQFDWWKPFYKDFVNDTALDWTQKRNKLYTLLNTAENIKPSETAVYSDLGFLTLSFILEKMFDMNLLDVWNKIHSEFYVHSDLHFNVNNKPKLDPKLYAPTEECPVRGGLMRGEVHDENTWFLGGVSSHAGLFGSIDDVSIAGLNMRSQLLGIANYKVKQKVAAQFAQRAIPETVGDWALGYMLPSRINASCGSFFSNQSIGHTGFTGTSLWFDPQIDLLVTVLSNRVNYGRDNKGFVQLRPKIHTWIFESIRRVI